MAAANAGKSEVPDLYNNDDFVVDFGHDWGYCAMNQKVPHFFARAGGNVSIEASSPVDIFHINST